MSENILIEAFGSIVNEDLRQDGVSLQDAMEAGLERLDAAAGLDDVETVITGMNGDVTFALQDAVEALDLDVDVQPFYPNVNNIAEEDDISYQEAWKKGFTWRNNRVFVDDEDDDEQDVVGLAVRFGDAGNNGDALLKHARRKGVAALDINLDDLIDRDAAYGGGKQEADADAEAEAEA